MTPREPEPIRRLRDALTHEGYRAADGTWIGHAPATLERGEVR